MIHRTLPLFILLLYGVVHGSAEEEPLVPPSAQTAAAEAPETVFQTQIGDADVDLYIDGFWESSVSGSIGAAIIPGSGFTYPYVFPGFTDGFVFEQKPDLTLSLWLMERYYFETVIGEEYRMNSYVLGYQGKEGEFVQAVRAGNKDIEISPYPYMDFPGSSRSSPGIMSMFQTGRSRHEILLRYDPSLPQKKTFIGKNAVEELRLEVADYTRGRFFVLPDDEVGSVEIYIEDATGSFLAGDGRRYRKATDFDAAYSELNGTVSLTQNSSGRVLAYYEKQGKPVGDSSLGKEALPAYIQATSSSSIEIDPLGNPEDFSWTRGPYMGNAITRYQISISGKNALLLYDPGLWTPFENLGIYSLEGFSYPQGTLSTPRLVNRGTNSGASTDTSLQFSIDTVKRVLKALAETDQERSFVSRYPFAEDLPLLYGPDRLKDGGGADFEILLQAYTPVQSYSLSNDVIPGSVTVLRNGKNESYFSVDYETGILSLSVEPAASDTLEIYYRTYSGEGEGGDILFGTGSTIELTDNLILKLAGGLRWNVLKGSYSTEPGDHPGTIGASAQVSYKRENFSLTADGAFMYINPDTSGLLRLLGMEKHEMTLEISKYNMFPSSVPDSSFFSGLLSNSNRGSLFFKNYESTDVLGGTSLNSYTYTPPSSSIFAYENGSIPGPYIAADLSSESTQIMVMEYELASDETWVGAQMNLSTGFDADLDLSQVSSIRFAYKVVTQSGAAANLYFQTGAIDEDLDDDGILDEEAGASSRGFSFNHGILTLYVGGGQKGLGNEKKDSEDANRDGILESENPELIYPGPSDDSSAFPVTEGGDWRTGLISIPGYDRNKLSAVRSVRFIIKKEGAGSSSGKVLIGKVVFEGTTLASSIDGEGSITLREISESLADITAPAALSAVDSSIIDTFHSGGGDQKVLEAKWTGLGTGDSWEVKTFTTEVPPDNYEKVNLYIRTASLSDSSAEYTFSYTDAEGLGVKVVVPVTATNRWQKLSVDIPRRTAVLGGNTVSGITVDSTFGKLTRFSFKGSGSEEGTVYIDELYLSSPAAGIGFAGSLETVFSIPGTVLSAYNVPILRNLAFSEKLTAHSEKYQLSLEDEATPARFSSATTASGDLLTFLQTEGEFSFSALEDYIEYEGGHTLRFPSQGGPVILTEKYKRNFHAEEETLSRLNRLEIFPGYGLNTALGTESYLTSGTITQKWNITAGFDRPDLPSLQVLTNFANSAGNYELRDESYGSSWISAYDLVFPWKEGTATERLGQFRLDGNVPGEPLGFLFSPELSYINTGAQDEKQQATEKISLELPFRFRRNLDDPGWRLSLLYDRNAVTYGPSPRSGNFPSDLRLLGETVQSQSYVYNSIPFWEILTPPRLSTFDGDSEGYSQAEYSSRAGLRYSRVYGSTIADLIVPSQAEGGIKKTLARDDDTLTATNTWDIKLTNTALNLFGSDGARPRFLWYKSDEFQLQNTYSLLTRENDPDKDWTFTTQQTASLFGHKNNQFILDHTITFENVDERYYRGQGSLKYLWRSEMINDFGSSLLQKARENGAYYEHTEKLETSYDDREGWTLSLVLGHETALSLLKNGYIKAELNLGIGFDRDYSGLDPGYRLLVGLGGGISVHLMF